MDSAFLGEFSDESRSMVTAQQPLLERRIVLRRFASWTGGNVHAGTAPTRTNYLIDVPAQMKTVTGKDIILSNGLYAIGDVDITTQLPVFGPEKKKVGSNYVGSEADEMILDNAIYILVGRPYPVPMAGGVTFYKSVWRKVS